MNLDTLWKEELTSLLKKIKVYRDLNKKIGKRGRGIFSQMIYGTHNYVVEYSPALDEKYIKQKAQEIYKNIFYLNVWENEIQCIQKDSLIGGFKVYFDDQMIDASFLKFYNAFKK